MSYYNEVVKSYRTKGIHQKINCKGVISRYNTAAAKSLGLTRALLLDIECREIVKT